MAVFVDLDEEAEPPNPQSHPYHHHIVAAQPEWHADQTRQQQLLADGDAAAANGTIHGTESCESKEVSKSRENANRNAMTEALGCYP